MSRCLSQIPYKLNNKSNNNNNIMNEEHHYPNLLEKKGIGAILDSEFTHSTTPNNSIKRTMSFDMSCDKWVKQDGFALKRGKSTEDLENFGEGKYEINEKMNDDNKENLGGRAFEDIWSSILSQKISDGTGSGDLAPYVHPLVKRASSLSEKSLEICTESLGSETGSDGFSNPPAGNEAEKEQGQEQEQEQEVEIKHDEVVNKVGNCNYYSFYPGNNKKVNNVGVIRSFPPPLPSLSYRDDGSNFHMRTRREDGRLVVDAVSVTTRKWFSARREDGRLVLTVDKEQVVGDYEEEVGCEDIEGNNVEKIELESGQPRMNEIVNVTRRPSSTIRMSKLMKVLCNRNGSTWPRASNMTIIRSVEEEEHWKDRDQVEVAGQQQKIVACSLPPRPKVSTATSAADVLNAYEYYWRRNNSTSVAAVAVLTPLAGKQNYFSSDAVFPQVVKDDDKKSIMNKFILEHNRKGATQEEMEEYLVPYLRGCIEPKSPLFWKPYCIATS